MYVSELEVLPGPSVHSNNNTGKNEDPFPFFPFKSFSFLVIEGLQVSDHSPSHSRPGSSRLRFGTREQSCDPKDGTYPLCV